ncbi:hypothetical protein AMJ44_06965 [candidate division WOR-1 bacterium DG_54_3]|uniref:Uncharacterized protein n=1 Tax=candidate division WOR-1 bacterium DG_54_3 TaxID=1703775 RepID=A0A0S7Y037_UNCSA|nr:MAG: hypothetical protein AMJ44_06965 [candidate division WOR-1 bacterium DG_54_3]
MFNSPHPGLSFMIGLCFTTLSQRERDKVINIQYNNCYSPCSFSLWEKAVKEKLSIKERLG